MSTVLRTVGPDGRTSCCGAFSTYVDLTEVCKVCYEEVLNPLGGEIFVEVPDESR